MNLEQKLEKLGITLPSPAKPVAKYVPVYKVSKECDLLFVSGQLSIDFETKKVIEGKLGHSLSVEKGVYAAKMAAIGVVAQLNGMVSSLDQIKGIAKLTVLVNAAPEFTEHPLVADGASNLMEQIFSESGVSSRAAFGVSSLPLNAAVEIEAVALV